MGTRSLQAGVSLLEMMVVVALVGIMGLFALPALSDLVERNRARALVELLRSSLAQARAESVITKQRILVCGSSDGVMCDGAWQSGWLVAPASDQSRLLSSHQLEQPNRLYWRGMAAAIQFHSNGTAPLGNGRFYICSRDQHIAWQLVLNRQGRVRIVEGLEYGQQVPPVCN